MDAKDRIEQEVSNALARSRTKWLLHAVAATTVLYLILSSWWLLAIPIYLFVSYQAMLFMTVNSLSKTLSASMLHEVSKAEAMRQFSEMKEKIDAGETQPTLEFLDTMRSAGLAVGSVVAVSEQILGRYQDADIHEWVEIKDSTSEQAQKYWFEHVAQVDSNGAFILPELEDKICACVNGFIYSRPVESIQPE